MQAHLTTEGKHAYMHACQSGGPRTCGRKGEVGRHACRATLLRASMHACKHARPGSHEPARGIRVCPFRSPRACIHACDFSDCAPRGTTTPVPNWGFGSACNWASEVPNPWEASEMASQPPDLTSFGGAGEPRSKLVNLAILQRSCGGRPAELLKAVDEAHATGVTEGYSPHLGVKGPLKGQN